MEIMALEEAAMGQLVISNTSHHPMNRHQMAAILEAHLMEATAAAVRLRLSLSLQVAMIIHINQVMVAIMVVVDRNNNIIISSSSNNSIR